MVEQNWKPALLRQKDGPLAMHILNLDLHWKKELPWNRKQNQNRRTIWAKSAKCVKGLLFYCCLQALGMRQIYEEFALNVIMSGTNITRFWMALAELKQLIF
jgi:hypothetical protein